MFLTQSRILEAAMGVGNVASRVTESNCLEVFLAERDFGPGLPLIVNLGAGQPWPRPLLHGSSRWPRGGVNTASLRFS